MINGHYLIWELMKNNTANNLHLSPLYPFSLLPPFIHTALGTWFWDHEHVTCMLCTHSHRHIFRQDVINTVCHSESVIPV